MAQRFRDAESVTLDASGAGSVTLAPRGCDWRIDLTTVTTSTSTSTPVATLYTGSISESNLLEATYDGSQDTSDTTHWVLAGEQLVCAWTGGDAGARATVRVSGVAYPPGTGVS